MAEIDVWKTIAVFLAGAMSAVVPLLWSMTRRPTFTQVEAMIAKELRLIISRFDHQEDMIGKVDRHVDEIKAKVETILIDVEAQRQVRSRAALEEGK